MQNISGFVFQDDVMMATMTVREAIMMSATLRLPATLTTAEKEKKVDDVIKLMNLEKAQHTIIGSSEVKGISGGERKRCAMSMEFITNPYILVFSLLFNCSSSMSRPLDSTPSRPFPLSEHFENWHRLVAPLFVRFISLAQTYFICLTIFCYLLKVV